MADWTHFESGKTGEPVNCSVCEAMLPDAVDGALTEAEQRAFERHVAGCLECAREFEEAQRGAAWLSMLKSKAPEPPADLLAKILAGTTGTQIAVAPAAAAMPVPAAIAAKPAAPAWAISSLWRKTVAMFTVDNVHMTFQPRLAMTAAMAFFSIALTLNLAGVRLRDLKAANFTPNGLRHSVGDMAASATHSFQTLRVVYQVESRVSELRSEESPIGDDRQPLISSPRGGDASPSGDSQPSNTPANNGNSPSQNPEQKNQDQKNDQPQPQGHSDLLVPVPQRSIRGGFVARKEV